MPFVAKLRVLVAPNRADPNPFACVEANERFRVGFACENAPPYDRPANPLRPLAEPNSDDPPRVEESRELEKAPVSPRPASPSDRLSKLESACDVETDDIRLELDEFRRAESPEFDEPLRIALDSPAESVPREVPEDDDRAAPEAPFPFRAPPNELNPSDLVPLEAAPPAAEVPRDAIAPEFDPRFEFAVAPP
jgi:hypothetical protein